MRFHIYSVGVVQERQLCQITIQFMVVTNVVKVLVLLLILNVYPNYYHNTSWLFRPVYLLMPLIGSPLCM